MEYILEVNSLTKMYPAFELKPISFHIKAGAVADSGTHDELLSHHGLYETMWNAHIEVKDHA